MDTYFWVSVAAIAVAVMATVGTGWVIYQVYQDIQAARKLVEALRELDDRLNGLSKARHPLEGGTFSARPASRTGHYNWRN